MMSICNYVRRTFMDRCISIKANLKSILIVSNDAAEMVHVAAWHQTDVLPPARTVVNKNVKFYNTFNNRAPPTPNVALKHLFLLYKHKIFPFPSNNKIPFSWPF